MLRVELYVESEAEGKWKTEGRKAWGGGGLATFSGGSQPRKHHRLDGGPMDDTASRAFGPLGVTVFV